MRTGVSPKRIVTGNLLLNFDVAFVIGFPLTLDNKTAIQPLLFP